MNHQAATTAASSAATTRLTTHGGNHRLSDEHLVKLRQSALSDDQIAALGYSTLPNGRLLIPYLKPDGTPEERKDGKPFTRERLSAAEIQADPAGGKYRSPKGNGCRFYHSALAIAAGNYENRLNNRFIPLRITEGEFKTESATVHDPSRVTIGLGGVSSWRDRYDDKDAESRPLVEFYEIPLDGREVRLCVDSDLRKPQVLSQLRGQAELLDGLGAYVLIEVLPNGLDGARLGLDDLIYRHGAEFFRRIAAIARSPFKRVKEGGQWVNVWAFDPEPAGTRERNTYLFGLAGPHWRSSPDGKDRWQRWTGAHWGEVAGDDELAAELESFAELQDWKNRELATFRSLQAAFRRTISQASDGAAVAGLVPFRNGCLRISGGALIPHNPQHGNTWSLPYDYDPQAQCKLIETFIKDRLDDDASVAVFRAFARCLLTGTRLKAFLEIVGASNTGKSVLTNLLVALVGTANHSACKLQRLEDATQRFETFKLKGKRLAVFSECQDYSGQLQTLKLITGGDSVAAEIKGGRHVDFAFSGGVVLTGNGPIRASDPTGAVINRRRSLHVGKVVAAADERQLLDPDGNGGWRGELVAELPGFVNWLLAMPAADARQALARDVQSIGRMEAELCTLLETDYLAAWSDRSLVWDASVTAQDAITVGNAVGNPSRNLYASYLQWISEQGPNIRPLALRTFKAKLVDLLRDTLGLPLPPGNPSNASAYKDHDRGSLVPCVRWRRDGDSQMPGVIRHAYQARIAAATIRTDGGWIPDGKNPVGDSRDGSDGFFELRPVRDPLPCSSPIAASSAENPSHPSVESLTRVLPSRIHPESIPNPSGTPAWLPDLLALRAERPDDHANQLANLLQSRHGVATTGKTVRSLLQSLDSAA